MQTSAWCLITRYIEEFLKEGKQMNTKVCAPTNNKICWSEILWDKCIEAVKKLQKRIVKAQKEDITRLNLCNG